MSSFTLHIHCFSQPARPIRTGSVVSVAYRLCLITHHVGTIPARFRSSCNRFASNTGVASASVTITTPVSFGLRRRGSNFFTLAGTSLVERLTSLWYASVESSNNKVCPVGAVSMTTISSSDFSTTSANARNIAISSVQGDSRSSFKHACLPLSYSLLTVEITSFLYYSTSFVRLILLLDRLPFPQLFS